MANTNIFITYDELSKLQKDSADKASVIAILNTEFPDDTCQIIAIKSILGLIKEEETTTEPETPTDDPVTDPEPSEGTQEPEGGEESDTTEPGEAAGEGTP